MTKQEIETFEKLLTSAAWKECVTQEERQAIWTAINVARRLHKHLMKFNIGDVVEWDGTECTIIGAYYDMEALDKKREWRSKYNIVVQQPWDRHGHHKFYETVYEPDLKLIEDVGSKVFMFWR